MGEWRRGARELTALMGVLAVTLALMVWGASSAVAGGPTSVLVTSPESRQASALYYSDKDYQKLERLLGPSGTGSKDAPPKGELDGARQINATWMAHDIWPWRMDRIFPGASGSGAVWIHTAADVPDSMNGYWHRADHPAQLRSLIRSLGVMDRHTSDGYTGIFPAPWGSPGTTATPAAGTAAVRVGSAETGNSTDCWANWWWTLPGVAAGAVLALAPQVSRNRWRRARVSGPRQELRDV